jgi:hypothetical protein
MSDHECHVICHVVSSVLFVVRRLMLSLRTLQECSNSSVASISSVVCISLLSPIWKSVLEQLLASETKTASQYNGSLLNYFTTVTYING